MAQPQSLLQSFSSALPTYPYTGGPKRAPDSGSTSKQTKPPLFAIRRPQNSRWSVEGQTYLNNLTAAGTPPQAPGHAQFSQFNNERLYNREDAILHRNEADVVRTAAMYLIHPVCQALSADSTAQSHISSQCEDNTVEGLRTDITYYKATAGRDRPFAIIEFKRRTIIKESEFNAAFQNFNPAAATAAADLARIVGAVPAPKAPQRHPSLFLSNSHRLLKQASAYAINNRTRYVALFDYDHLVLLFFPELDHTQTTASGVNAAGGVGRYVEMDIYPFPTDSNQMRRALLGFLHDAYVNTPN